MTRLMSIGRIIGTALSLLLSAPFRPSFAETADQVAMAADISQNHHWVSPSSYKRIRITEREDIEATYPLIARYVQNPSLALSVNEMIVDPDAWPSRWRSSFSCNKANSELDEPPKPVSEDAHAAVEAYVRGLGLGNGTTNAMLSSLRWKKSHLLGHKPTVSDGGFVEYNRKYADTATALLLSLTRNLETLHMGAMDHNSSPLEDYLLNNNHGRLTNPGLQKLKTLRYIAVDNQLSRDDRSYDELDFLTHLRCFHRLPALQTVDMDAVMEYQRVTRNFYPPHTASFKNLSITHADISSDMLASMIRLPRALEDFTLSMGGLWHRDGGSPLLYHKTLGKALREHRATLRSLDLDLGDVGRGHEPEDEARPELEEDEYDDDMDEWYRLDDVDSTGPPWTYQLPDGEGPFGLGIGSLREFGALRRLSIDVHVLLGWNREVYDRFEGQQVVARNVFNPPFRLVDALPQGLEELKLYDYVPGRDATVDSHVRELMRLKRERLPNLRTVEGVEETIEVMGDRSSDRDEGELWRRPEREVHWVKDEL